jgi:hypothetical protein
MGGPAATVIPSVVAEGLAEQRLEIISKPILTIMAAS